MAQLIGINGFGRIGRTAFRVWWQRFRDSSHMAVVNTSGSSDINAWAHLLKYDSNYGVWPFEIRVEKWRGKDEVTDEQPELGKFIIDGREIIVTAQRDPAKIPWGRYGVDTVIESTGKFTDAEKAGQHFAGGARRVVMSGPAKDDTVTTVVLGANTLASDATMISNASCTTNCVAPVARVMVNAFGVEKAMLTTVHAYTDDQNLHDNSHKDLRRARAAAQNIVPTTTGAAQAAALAVPELKGVFDGLSIRVPVPVGSISDMVFLLKRDTSVEEINRVLTEAANSDHLRGILAVTHDPLVSRDIIGRSESSIVDLALTQVVGGNLVKVVSWYDNEWGYCNRLLEVVVRQ